MTLAMETSQQPTQLKQLRRLARKVLAAREAEQAAKDTVNNVKPDMVELFHELGINIVEAAPGQSVQLVEPVTRRHDEQAIERYIKRYNPELYDLIFPPVRKLDTGRLRDFIERGDIKRTVEKHISDVSGTPQLRRVVR